MKKIINLFLILYIFLLPSPAAAKTIKETINLPMLDDCFYGSLLFNNYKDCWFILNTHEPWRDDKCPIRLGILLIWSAAYSFLWSFFRAAVLWLTVGRRNAGSISGFAGRFLILKKKSSGLPVLLNVNTAADSY